MDVGSSGVAMDVTQPAWPLSVARSVRVSAMVLAVVLTELLLVTR